MKKYLVLSAAAAAAAATDTAIRVILMGRVRVPTNMISLFARGGVVPGPAHLTNVYG